MIRFGAIMPSFRVEQKIRGFTPRINTHDIKLVTNLLQIFQSYQKDQDSYS